jgi:hypothetical protein
MKKSCVWVETVLFSSKFGENSLVNKLQKTNEKTALLNKNYIWNVVKKIPNFFFPLKNLANIFLGSKEFVT